MAIRHTVIQENGTKTFNNLTRGRAIREKCMECCCWQGAEVRKCAAKDCALYPYRMGSVARAVELEDK